MRNLLTISVIASLTFISCKKERSAELNGGGGTSNTPMLSRAVISYGTDSSVTELTYDANKKLTSISTADPQQGTSSSTITRNSQGIIQQISMFDGSSSTDYKVNYNSTSKQYTSQVSSFGGEKDSIAYKYASGRIVEAIDYYDDGSSGGYLEYTKTVYTYDANGNITKTQFYIYDDATAKWEDYFSLVSEFDNKVNALNIGVEAILINEVSYAGANNVAKMTFIDPTDPASNDVLLYTYVYNSDSRPKTGEATIQSLGVKAPLKFYYK